MTEVVWTKPNTAHFKKQRTMDFKNHIIELKKKFSRSTTPEIIIQDQDDRVNTGRSSVNNKLRRE